MQFFLLAAHMSFDQHHEHGRLWCSNNKHYAKVQMLPARVSYREYNHSSCKGSLSLRERLMQDASGTTMAFMHMNYVIVGMRNIPGQTV